MLRNHIDNGKMKGKTEKPFAIVCRHCGSNHVVVTAYEFRDLGFKCMKCGYTFECGVYNTETSVCDEDYY